MFKALTDIVTFLVLQISQCKQSYTFCPGLKWAVISAWTQMTPHKSFCLHYSSFLCLIKGAQLLSGWVTVGPSAPAYSNGKSLRDKSKLGWARKLFSTTTETPAITSSVCHSTWSNGGARTTTTFVPTKFLISIPWGIKDRGEEKDREEKNSRQYS